MEAVGVIGLLSEPFVFRTAISAAESKAFCFSAASCWRSRASRRALILGCRLEELLEEPLVRWSWVATWLCLVTRGAGGEILYAGGMGSSFLLSVGDGVFTEVFAALRTLSEPDAGGVGGSARFGGGDGRGGVSSLLLPTSGVAGRETVTKLDRLLRLMAVRDIEADRGLGLYFVPSPRRISLVGFGGDFALAKGTSSATNITGLNAIFAELGLPLVVAGDTGV